MTNILLNDTNAVESIAKKNWIEIKREKIRNTIPRKHDISQFTTVLLGHSIISEMTGYRKNI